MDDMKDSFKQRVDHIRDQAGDVVERFAEKLHTPKEEMEFKSKMENNKRRFVHTES
jgi:hypothetical protein